LTVFAAFLMSFPHFRFDTGKKLIVCNYDGDFSEYEENASYNELYFYYEELDISIRTFNVKKFLFFHTVHMEYITGDFRETQFVLPEAYIKDFLKNAKITENEKNINLSELIKGKTAIVGNTRYLGNEYNDGILYKLNGEYEELFIFYVDDLLVIQVGSPDELPKFIAYK
jgi:hypothetical protein